MEERESEKMVFEGEDDQDIGSVVLSHFQSSDSKRDRQLCGVASTVSEELKGQGFPLNPVAYFGAIFSTLKRMSQDPLCGLDPSLEALLTFLAMVMPAVSPAVLRSKAVSIGELMKVIVEIEGVPDSVIKAAMNCICRLLVAGDKANWSQVQILYKFLLGFVTSKREKVRMHAHSCLRDVLQSFEGTHILSSASEEIVDMFREFLSVAGGSNSTGKVDTQGPRGVWEVLFVLNALRDSLSFLSNKSRTKILKYLKSLLTLQQPIVTRAIVEILQSLCCCEKVEIPAEILLDILCFIASSVTEEEKSADAIAAVARLLQSGVKKVYDLNRSISRAKLPLVFSTLGEILTCDHEEAIFAAMESFKGLIYSCIDQNLINEGKDHCLSPSEATRVAPTSIEKICATLEGLLGYRYSDVFDMSFQIISAMFDKLGESSFYLMEKTVKSLANLEKLSDEEQEFPYRKQLHECIGSAVSALGPEMFLRILPFAFESASEMNFWQQVLPIMKQRIVGAKLGFFKHSILVTINQLNHKSQELERVGHVASARAAKGAVYSLWSLFPSFCNYPSDTADSFKTLQRELCETLHSEPELRGLICSSLQMLIQQNKTILEMDNGASVELSIHERKARDLYTNQLAKENLNVLRSFAKESLKDLPQKIQKEEGICRNIVTVLCKIFLDSSKASDGYLQYTIREYASIMDKKDVKSFFRKIINQLLDVTKEAAANGVRTSSTMQIDSLDDENSLTIKRARLLELATSFLPGLGIEEMSFLLSSCIKPGVEDEEGIIQKKSYKILSVILKENSLWNNFVVIKKPVVEHDEILSSKLDVIIEMMIDVLPSCHFSAKRYRLESLYFIIIYLSKDPSKQRKQEIISSFLTEIILALKEDNKKTRNRAYDLLVKFGHACADEDQGGKKENLQAFFNMVAGGLAGETPYMISAAVKGLARLTYEFSDLLSAAFNLLPSAFLLLQRRNREICKANLGFVKVLVAKSQTDWLHMHLKGIVEGLLKWQNDTKNHFKAKVKLLLEMLVKKCGLDAVKEVMPGEHMKLLTNIRKITECKEKKNKSEKDTRSIHSRASSRHSRWNHTSIFSNDVDDNDDTEVGYTDSKTVTGSRGKASKISSLRSKNRRSSKRLPGDALNRLEEDPLDLLDGQRTRAALASSHLKRKVESDDEPEIGPDGRLVLNESGRKHKREKSEKTVASDNDFDVKSNAGSNYSLTKAQKMRQRTDSGWAYTGSEYTSKKASGDIKKKNKLEPYAYWPLDRKLLNRREENKAIARKGMASVMKVTKKLEGKSASAALSLKGMKAKRTPKRKIKKHK